MTELQLVSFVLLWIVIGVEGTLLYMLYRHVGLIYARGMTEWEQGLPAGSDAPQFTARDRKGRILSLWDLIEADYQLFVFGSVDCAPCHTLVESRELGDFLGSRHIRAYLLVESNELGQAATPDAETGRSEPLTTLGVGKQVFSDYRVDATPFAYLIDRSGKVKTGTAVAGVQHLIDVCVSTKLEDEAHTEGQVEVPLRAEETRRGQPA